MDTDDQRDVASRIAALEQHVAILHERVQALEAPATPPDGPERGVVSYTGMVEVGAATYGWTIELGVNVVQQASPEHLASIVSALGSVPRIQIVRALLNGPMSSHQLQDALGMASAGPLYHHLKELVAAGIVEQPGRSDYRLAPKRVIPTLVILTAALDISGALGK